MNTLKPMSQTPHSKMKPSGDTTQPQRGRQPWFTAALVASLALSGSGVVQAAEPPFPEQPFPEQSAGGAVTTGSFVTGALAAGPVGAIAGLVVGGWLGKKVDAANQAEDLSASQQLEKHRHQQQLATAERRIQELSAALAQAQQRSTDYAQLILDELQITLMFRTADEQLDSAGHSRLDNLGRFLVNNPQLTVQLDGYADPRGDSAYNQRLSQQRVDWVSRQLQQRGVAAKRIHSQAHGDTESRTQSGDYDGYALERVVNVRIYSTEHHKDLVNQAPLPPQSRLSLPQSQTPSPQRLQHPMQPAAATPLVL